MNNRISDEFHIFYENNRIWENNSWLGIPMWKLPMDAFVLQEIIFRNKPEVIIETGTGKGGSAIFYASIFELMGSDGKVFSIDSMPDFEDLLLSSEIARNKKILDRIEFVFGDSISDSAISLLRQESMNLKTMVVLDSWHSEEHVYKELELYSKLVSINQYLVVEDTHCSSTGNPVKWKFRDQGPSAAVDRFLKKNKNFVVDYECEKHIMTFNPGSWMKRVG